MVAVLVRDEQELCLDAFNRWIVEPHPSRSKTFHDAERVDENRLSAAKQERRLAIPADVH